MFLVINESFIIMLNAVIRRSVKETGLLSNWVVGFIQRRSCWMYVKIFKNCPWWTVRQSNNLLISICNQLHHLKTALDKKRPSLVDRKGVIFHHDNVCTHTAQLSKDLSEKLVWRKLHCSYYLDFAPSHYYLFRGLQNHLDDLRLTSRE